jgi:hypothetical protein
MVKQKMQIGYNFIKLLPATDVSLQIFMDKIIIKGCCQGFVL